MADYQSSAFDAETKAAHPNNGKVRRRLRWSSKVLLVGIGLSLLVLAVGKLNTLRLEKLESALESSCRTSNRLPALSPGFKMHVSPEKIPAGANVFDQYDEHPPAWALADVRAKYPQIRDLSDDDLALRLSEKYPGVLVCDAETLMTDGRAVGIQEKIVEAQTAVTASAALPVPLAIAVSILLAVPWAWYALLRRIGELRAAIGGNPPER